MGDALTATIRLRIQEAFDKAGGVPSFDQIIAEYGDAALEVIYGFAPTDEVDASALAEAYLNLMQRSTPGLDPDAEDRFIGFAFTHALLANLPMHLKDPAAWLPRTVRADTELYAALEHHPSVLSAGPPAHRLPQFGITPATYADAAAAISRVFRKFWIRNNISEEESAPIVERPTGSRNDIPLKAIVDEVISITDLTMEIAAALVGWLLEVGTIKPRLFDGFAVTKVDSHFWVKLMHWPQEKGVDLLYNWSFRVRPETTH